MSVLGDGMFSHQIFAVSACYNLHVMIYISLHAWTGKNGTAHERFTFSLWSASNDHYMERTYSSSTTLPTVNDISCKIAKMNDHYSCTVYALLFQDTLQRGWLKHSNRVKIALACRHTVMYPLCCNGSYTLCKLRPRLQSLAA